MTASVRSRVRCAIYTRKSSEEGLEQSFNSLQAQREACEAYVASQRHEGWQIIAEQYDDGGFSGGNMNRPALKQLLDDIAARLVDTVVVYKVDRLTRSLADFAKIIEIFDKLQLGILLLQFLQPSCLVHPQAAILLAPPVVGLLRDPDFLAGLRRHLPVGRSHLNLPQQTHDLLCQILFPSSHFKLHNFAELQSEKGIVLPIFDYDQNSRTMRIVDSTFYFFLRHVDKNAVLKNIENPVDRIEKKEKSAPSSTSETTTDQNS